MGYEVLDSGGGRPPGGSPSSGPGPSSGPLDVVDLDGTDPGGHGHDTHGEPQQGAVGRLARSLEQAPPTVWRMLAGGLAALLCGVVAGGVAVRNFDDGEASRADRAVLSAGAAVLSIESEGPPGPNVVQLRVQALISNYGPVPIRMLTGRARPTRSDITATGGSPEVAPDSQAQFDIDLTVDCFSDRAVAVPVLTADQRRHEVPLRGLDDTALAAFCSSPDQAVQVRVIGTLERPQLEISNTGPRDLNFTLTSQEDAGVGVGGRPLITLTTDPTAPVTVGARAKRSVALVLTAQRCVRDVTQLPAAVHLLVEGRLPADNDVATTSGTDLSALTGAAVARACAG